MAHTHACFSKNHYRLKFLSKNSEKLNQIKTTMMMMMKSTIVLALALVLSPTVLPVAQAELNRCSDLPEDQCNALPGCTFIKIDQFNKLCFLTTGEGSVVRQGEDNVAPGELW